MSFPLFSTLLAETEGNVQYDLSSIVDHVKLLDEEGFELTYAIIRYYQISYDNDTVKTTLPYGSKFTKQGLKIDFANLPQRLLMMMSVFLQLHTQKMETDRQRRLLIEKN